MLAAKAAVVTGLALAAGVWPSRRRLLAGRLSCPATGSSRPPATRPCHWPAPVPRAAVGSVLYLALIALLSLGVAAMMRDSPRPSAWSSA